MGKFDLVALDMETLDKKYSKNNVKENVMKSSSVVEKKCDVLKSGVESKPSKLMVEVKPKVVLSQQLIDNLKMRSSAFISMLKSKRPSKEVATYSGISIKTIQRLRKKFLIEVK